MTDKYPKDQLPSEEQFSTIIEQSPFSIQVISPDGFTKRVNRAWEELWGLKFEQIKARTRSRFGRVPSSATDQSRPDHRVGR